MKKVVTWLVRGVGIIVIFLLVTGAITYFSQPGRSPSEDKAQYGFQTYSQDEMKIPCRIYYSDDVEMVDGHPVIGPGYWDFDGESYHYHRGTKELPENTKMVRRK